MLATCQTSRNEDWPRLTHCYCSVIVRMLLSVDLIGVGWPTNLTKMRVNLENKHI